MEPEAIIFGLATFAALRLSLRGSALSQACAWALVVVYGAANVLWEAYALAWLPFVDLPVAMGFYVALMVRPSAWTFCAAVSFAFRMPLHIAGEWGLLPLGQYLHWINAAFLAALIAVSWEGGVHALSDCVRYLRRVRDARCSPDPAVPSAGA